MRMDQKQECKNCYAAGDEGQVDGGFSHLVHITFLSLTELAECTEIFFLYQDYNLKSFLCALRALCGEVFPFELCPSLALSFLSSQPRASPLPDFPASQLPRFQLSA